MTGEAWAFLWLFVLATAGMVAMGVIANIMVMKLREQLTIAKADVFVADQERDAAIEQANEWRAWSTTLERLREVAVSEAMEYRELYRTQVED